MVPQDNITLYTLEMMYKNRDPPLLWNILTDDLMHKILSMVDPQFTLPSINFKTYTDQIKNIDIPDKGKIETIKIIKKNIESIEQVYEARHTLDIKPEVTDNIRLQLEPMTPAKPPEIYLTEQLLQNLEEDRKITIIPTNDTYEDVVKRDIDTLFCRSLCECDDESEEEM